MILLDTTQKVITMDVTAVLVATITGFFGLMAAFVAAGAFTRRTVRKAVESSVNGHADDEMEKLKAIEDELRLMRMSQTAANELHATLAATQDRRFSLLEQRVEQLESV